MDEIIIKKDLDLKSFSDENLEMLIKNLFYNLKKIKGEQKKR